MVDIPFNEPFSLEPARPRRSRGGIAGTEIGGFEIAGARHFGHRFDGTSFVPLAIAKRFDGNSFVDLVFIRRWNGTEWVDML